MKLHRPLLFNLTEKWWWQGYSATKGNFIVTRYMESGAPDAHFGLNGKVTTHFRRLSNGKSIFDRNTKRW
jgi:hypothetical protein